MTNYERINDMSVEEMAAWLFKTSDCSCCAYCRDRYACSKSECIDGIKRWLKNEK